MNPIRVQSTHGTVSLVALCLVTVTGIVLGSYLTLCSRAMNLSNRSYQAGVAQQLAEFGVEEGLRAFNKNNWSGWSSSGMSVVWDTTTYAANKRAVATVTFPASKFGQGVTASVKIRIDNYDAAQLDSPWASSVNYRTNDLVGDSGVWYRCLSAHTSSTALRPPNLTYWAPAPIPWAWSTGTTYTESSATQNSSVVYNGTSWYYCTTGHTTPTSGSFSVTNWTAMPAPSLQWNASTSYDLGTFVFYNGTWYRCTAANTGTAPPNASYWSTDSPNISWSYRSGVTYKFNDVVYYSASGSGTWYRCKVASTTSLPTNGASWENALTGAWGWDSVNRVYNLGDVVYYSTRWYRCTLAHTSTSSLPLSPGSTAGTAYWSSFPLFSTIWDSSRQYGLNDIVSHNGVWYRCLAANEDSRPTPSNTAWASAVASSNQWSATANYTANTSYVSYGGVWYKCTTANIGQSPNDASYWTSTWPQTSGLTTGGPVVYAESSVAISNSPPIRTQLRASINPATLFPNALTASTTIQTSGAGTIDSYDSVTDPSAATRGYSAVVAAGSTSGTAVSLSNTTVQGYLAAPSASSPPYAPLISSGGSLKNSDGSVTSPASGNMNLDLTRISRSPNIPQFDTVPQGPGGLLSTWGFNPTSVLIPSLSTATTIGTPGATTPTRYYSSSDVTFSGSSSLLNIIGPVILYIRGNLTLDSGSPNGRINIASTGAAEIHLTGALRVRLNSDGINNTTRDPTKLVIISDSTSAAQNYSDGTVPFYGLMYMPYTTSSAGLTFDGSSTMQIYGAASARKIIYSVNANVHYDTSLRYASIPGVDQPYTITDWRILPATEQATMP